MVDKEHIDVLVLAARLVRSRNRIASSGLAWWIPNEDGLFGGWRTLEPYRMGDQPMMTSDELGHMLWQECLASVLYRYPEDTPETVPGLVSHPWTKPYVYEAPGFQPTPGEVFQTIDCYSYQSCEHPSWYRSEAESFCRSLRSAWCGFVPGYHEAPWGWTDEDVAKRKREHHKLTRTVEESANSIR